jgi:trans-aconitate methyltransferase
VQRQAGAGVPLTVKRYHLGGFTREQTARAQAAAARLENVSFTVGDAASIELDRGLDAVVGRCGLFFTPEPAALVHRLADHVRHGGIVAFQEPANATPPLAAVRTGPGTSTWRG